MIKLLSPAQNQCVLGKNQREEVNAMRKYEIMYIINPTVLEEGREEGKIDSLINFFKNGVGLDIISKGLGMSIEEVKSILIGRGFEV